LSYDYRRLSEDEKNELMKFLYKDLHIIHVIFCTGKWEAKIEMHVKSQDQFNDILSNIKCNFKDIIDKEPYCFRISEEFKLNYLVRSVFNGCKGMR
jgi:hypothetical protein